MSNIESSLSVTAAILTVATIYRRQEPPAEDSPEEAMKSVLTTYRKICDAIGKTESNEMQ